MNEQPSALVLEFLSWLSRSRRTYGETMEAWRTSCPRQSIWEDALGAGLVRINGERREVVLTPRGKSLLNGTSGPDE